MVGRFVEFFGPGLAAMPLADRATIANMCPEYGATVGFFPVDEQTLAYLRLTGRDEARVEAVEQYCRLQGLWRDAATEPAYASVVDIDLAAIVPSLAGPRRPQDRVDLDRAQQAWRSELAEGFKADPSVRAAVAHDGAAYETHPRQRGHRRHHLLHQHLQPRRHGGRRAAGPARPGARPLPASRG